MSHCGGNCANCSGCARELVLTQKEIETLPMGAKMMTYECGIRFLTDYLDGDKYFHIACPDHNLVRARNQLTLVRRMEEAYETMKQITEEVLNENSRS